MAQAAKPAQDFFRFCLPDIDADICIEQVSSYFPVQNDDP
jgi:hypothetical protein